MPAARLSALFLGAFLLLPAAAVAQSGELENGGFETPGKNVPPGWSVPTTGYAATVIETNPYAGKRCAFLEKKSTVATPAKFGNLMQSVDAKRFRGKRVKLTGYVRVDGKEQADAAAMWMRVDCPGGKKGFFDNMGNRQIREAKWKPYVIAGNVEDDASTINVGVMAFGNASVWIDEVTLEPVGDAIVADQPPRPLTDKGLRNIVALTRLLGYVRFFHPSEETKDLDWETFTIAALDKVEGADSPRALATALQGEMAAVAPGVQIWAGEASGGPPEMANVAPAVAPQFVYYEHLGVGLKSQGIYKSERFVRPRAGAPAESRPAPGMSRVKDLGGGVSCRVPIVLVRDDKGTLPHAKASRPAGSMRPDGWVPSGNDRATRIAAVMLAWTVFQHFYPYFDVVKTDWNEALRAALTRAATDKTVLAFQDTLRELVAKLHDGHGGVFKATESPTSMLALELAWAGDDLVVDRVVGSRGDTAARGDVVLAIDGTPIAEHVTRESKLISAATDGWRRYRLLTALRMMTTSAPCPVKLRPVSGPERVAKVGRISPERPERPENAPKNGDEVAPGVVYFDMNGATEKDFEPHVAKLAAAKGIVFDMRGYPAAAGTLVIRHLATENLTSAQWRVPVVLLPDQEAFDCPQRPGWTLTPLEPHFDAKVAFVTDGRAISYAESCMGIIEHYKLGAIVGETTAGTNGNVNPFMVPGGYSISWTGMRVLKHDGSQHHGVGIRPTVPCSRTVQGIAAGRDELLEKAIEVVRP